MQAAQTSKLSSIEISAKPSQSNETSTDPGLSKHSFNTERTESIHENKTTSTARAFIGAMIKKVVSEYNKFKQDNLKSALDVDIKGALGKFDGLIKDFGSFVETRNQLAQEGINVHPSMANFAKEIGLAGVERLQHVREKASKIEELLAPLGMSGATFSKELFGNIKGDLTEPQVSQIRATSKEFDNARVKTAEAMNVVDEVIKGTMSEITLLKESMSKGIQSWVNSQLDGAAQKYTNAVTYHLRNPQAKESELIAAKNEFIEAYKKAIEGAEELHQSSKEGVETRNKMSSLLKDLTGKNLVSKEHQMSVSAETSGKVYVKISPQLGKEIAEWIRSYTRAESLAFRSPDCTLEERARHGAALASKMEEVEKAIQKIGAVLAKSHNRYDDVNQKNTSPLDRLLLLDSKEDKSQATAACQGLLAKMQIDSETHIIETLEENLKQKQETTPAHFEQMAKELAFTAKAVELLEIHVRPEGKVYSWEQLAKEAKTRLDQGFASLKKKEDEVAVPADLKKLADKVFAPEEKKLPRTFAGWLEGTINRLTFLFRKTK